MMKPICWNSEKNQWLLRNRGVCFEQVLVAFARDETLDVLEHPNQQKYPGQMIAIVQIGNYAYLVPYVENEEELFLKTIIPSRKATEEYLEGRK